MNNRVCRAWLMIAFIVVAVVGAWGCGKDESGKRVTGKPVDLSDVTQPEERRAPQSENGLDLDLVSDLFFAGMVLHPQEMLTSEAITAKQVRAFLGEWANSDAIPFERCQRIIMLLPMVTNPNQPMLPVVKLEFDSAVNLGEILDRGQQELFKPSPNHVQLWTSKEGRVAAYQYGQQTLLFGERDYVLAVVEGRIPPAGRLAELMGQMKLDRDLVGVLNGEALAAMTSSMQQGAAEPSSVPPMAVEFSLDLSDETLGILSVEVASEEEAKAIQDQFGSSLQMVRMMSPLLIQSLASEAPAQTRSLLSRVIKEMTAGLQIGGEGKQVTIKLSRPDELPEAIAGFAEILIEARKLDQRESKLKQVAQAMLKYHDEHEQFPWLAALDDHADPQGLSWRVYLLPMLGHQELFDRFHLDEAWDSEHNSTLIGEMPKEFDTVGKSGETSMVLVQGEETAWTLERPTRIKDIQDGTVQTIMLIDVGAENSVPWTRPDQLIDDPTKPFLQKGIERVPTMIVATFDGETHRVASKVSDKDFRALLSSSGKEEIDYRRILGIPDPDRKPRGLPMGGFPFGSFR